MLIILTNSEDATVTYLCPILEESKIPYLRLDTDRLICRAALSYGSGAISLRIDDRWHNATEIADVWYRRPEVLKDARLGSSPEGRYTVKEWSESLENFFCHVPKQRWMNHPSANAAASHKLKQLTVAAGLGFRIPETLVTQDSNTLREFFETHREQVIAKPIGDGYVDRPSGESDAIIYTNRVFTKHLADLTDLATCPTLVQRFIEKQCDVRITVVDHDIHAIGLFGCDEDGLQRCDIRRNNMLDVEYRPLLLPEVVSEGIRSLMSHYSLRFAAIDMAIDRVGNWYFFEINPNGQWAWLDLCGGVQVANSFVTAFRHQDPNQNKRTL